MTHLHFTFGPVQGFVAQARRTRDLYAGSLLLSHLARAAMQEVKNADGGLVLPHLATIERLAVETKHAVAPNRFIAEFTEPAGAVAAARRAEAQLLREWRGIAAQVYLRFLASVASQGLDTLGIWDRQIAGFWEVAWAVGRVEETDLLDRRKNWRTPPTSVEPGDHCTLMGEWQELSGFIRSQQRSRQNAFWSAVRERILAAKGSELDLEDDERLCAMAFVKRFFPLVAEDAVGRDLGMGSWPSTVSIAAVPWLRRIKAADPGVLEECKRYAELACHEPGAKASSARRVQALREFPAEAGEFPRLSGNFLNRTALKNKRGTPLRNKHLRARLLAALETLEKTTDDRASCFYALLLMDGDSMGRLLRVYRPERVTRALTAFAEQAPSIVGTNDGVCVYAGGDDVLALLPLDRALEAAAALRRTYCETFRTEGISEPTDGTTSAGLVFAHYRCAFSRVLGYAHELLEAVAKDGAGRDAIAVGVMKPGGVTCQWCGKFGTFIAGGSHCFAPLIDAYRNEPDGDCGTLSASFLYNLRKRFAGLFGEEPEGTATAASVPFNRDTLSKLFLAEYLHDKLDRKDASRVEEQRDQATRLIERLISVCEQPGGRFKLDGARLVKFLACAGKEGAE